MDTQQEYPIMNITPAGEIYLRLKDVHNNDVMVSLSDIYNQLKWIESFSKNHGYEIHKR